MVSVVVREAYEAINEAIDWLNRFAIHAPIVFGGEGALYDQLQQARHNLEIAYPELKVEEGKAKKCSFCGSDLGVSLEHDGNGNIFYCCGYCWAHVLHGGIVDDVPINLSARSACHCWRCSH